MPTIADYLKSNGFSISPSLISPANLKEISTRGNYFPKKIASIFGFECSLNNPVPTVDFFFCTRARDKANYLINDRRNSLLADPVWRNIALFYRDWCDRDSFLARKVEDIWWEFDLASDRGNIFVPSIFLDASNIHTQAEWQYIVRQPLQLLLGKSVERSTQQMLFNCLQALPKNVSWFQIGLLLSRNPQNLRLYTTAISLQQIQHYLSQLKYQGDLDLLANILNRISGLVDKYQLQLEIGQELSSTIAIEFYCYNQNNLQSLLDYLTTTGFCLSEKRDALLAFPGSNTQFTRRIAYLKMTYTPDYPLQFKAYLGITPKT